MEAAPLERWEDLNTILEEGNALFKERRAPDQDDSVPCVPTLHWLIARVAKRPAPKMGLLREIRGDTERPHQGKQYQWPEIDHTYAFSMRWWAKEDPSAEVMCWRLEGRSWYWNSALASWTCPRVARCDPCGDRSSFGNFDHVYCRGPSSGKNSDGRYDGYVTNLHLSDLKLDGPIPEELCLFSRLRELDLDGGRLESEPGTGHAVPEWVPDCFPDLAELDLSYNRLSGTIPGGIFEKFPQLEEFEISNNRVEGTLPANMGAARKLREIELHNNRLTGTLPPSLSLLNETLTAITLADNDLSGELGPAVAGASLFRVSVHNNPGLCGMVPAGVRFANGYNPHGTGLGKPCPA
ncbi:unnamed protein product [Pedinophyceae sp. YPF-701]|nr:unnamed protein product [Pedinophyceae sp. YPF-701]